MARRKYRVFRILGWMVVGCISLILILTLGFYLGRGWIMQRAVSYVNEIQPGELRMEQMNLIPFKNFPDVSLQLKNISYNERADHPDSLYQEPILSLNELQLTLDVMDLIRRDIQVSEITMQKGFLRLEMYEDSITNLEKALGRRLLNYGSFPEEDAFISEERTSTSGEEEKSSVQGERKGGVSGMPMIRANMDKMELADMMLIYNDRTGDNHVSLQVHQLESTFSYLPDKVEGSVELNLDINSVKYLTYKDETVRNVVLKSEVMLRPEQKTIDVKPSSLGVSGLELETWGSYGYSGKPELDFEFSARNEGLELLNYIFRGILDLDELEQIGGGSISLAGSVKGFLGDTLPTIHLTGNADEIGFRIKSIQKEVSGISFNLHASNGSQLDFSEGFLRIDNFRATFPEGDVSGHVSAYNLQSPELKVQLNGELDLLGLEEMIQADFVSGLEGRLAVNGDMQGTLDRKKGRILNSQGYIHSRLDGVGFMLPGDSARTFHVKQLNGQVGLEENQLSSRSLTMELNGNRLELGFQVENLLLHLMGFEKDVSAMLKARAEHLNLFSLVRDSGLVELLGDEWTDLQFTAAAQIGAPELDSFMENRSIPVLDLSVDSFGVKVPAYADIDHMNASLSLGADTLFLHYLTGSVGESAIDFSGYLSEFRSLTGQDSAQLLGLGFHLKSELLRAEDLFTLRDDFLLPEDFKTEQLEDFHLVGSAELPLEGLRNDSLSMDFALNVKDLGGKLRYYPLPFTNFQIQARREGEQLHIDNFQGSLGESNLKVRARVENFRDTLVENLKGELVVESDILDFNRLLTYHMPGKPETDQTKSSPEISPGYLAETRPDSAVGGQKEPPRLDQIAYPQFRFSVDIGELRYREFNFYDLKGVLRSSNEKIFHLDQLSLSGKSGGSMAFQGQFNVANPENYSFSAQLDMQDMNVDDLDIDMQIGDSLYTLKENFDGLVSADGMAEIFISPDLKVDMASSTALFNVLIKDGALINFTPLHAAAKFLENRDLNFVKFDTLQNGYPLTLMDSRIHVPLMIVESTAGLMLIEGEQGLDKSFLYLLRIPPSLAREAARSVLTEAKDKQEEDQIQEMRRGNFYVMTVWSDGITSDFKLGDKRDKFQE